MNGRTSGKFTFEVVENDRFTDGNNQLLVAIVVVNSEEDRIDPLGRPQSGHDTQILGKSLCRAPTHQSVEKTKLISKSDIKIESNQVEFGASIMEVIYKH